MYEMMKKLEGVYVRSRFGGELVKIDYFYSEIDCEVITSSGRRERIHPGNLWLDGKNVREIIEATAE